MGSLIVCAGLLGSALAHADGDHDEQRGRREERQPAREVQRDAPRERQPQGAPQQQQQQPQRVDQQRQLDPRSFEARAEDQRRAIQDAGHNAEMSRRMGRMTPDERRDLRRQINEAGQDLYANPPRH